MKGSEQTDDSPAQRDEARLARAMELDGELRELVRRQRVQGVAVVDQLVAQLNGLVRLVDETHGYDGLPDGLRMQLVRASCEVLGSAIMGLKAEWTEVRPREDVFEQAIQLLCQLGGEALERRVNARARAIACELDPRGGDDRYDDVTQDFAAMDDLIRELGFVPTDDAIRRWLVARVDGPQQP